MDPILEAIKKQSEQIKTISEKVIALDKQKTESESVQKEFITQGGGPTIITRRRTGSYETQLMDTFSVKSLPELLKVDTSLPVFEAVDPSLKSAVFNLKEKMQLGRWIAQIFYGAEKDTETNVAHVKGILDTYYGKSEIVPLLKAFGSTVVGEGDEWVPTGMASTFVGEFLLERKLATEWQRLPMPNSPWDLPVQINTTTARIATEGSAMTSNNFGTDRIRFTAVKFGEFYALPEELNEDSAPAILALARQEIMDAQVRAIETATINGDSDGTHQDSDTQAGGADLAEKAVDGIRKLGLANSANGGDVDFSAAAVTTANLDLMRTQMGKFGTSLDGLRYVLGPTAYNQTVQLNEVSSVDQIGNNATLVKGALASFRGIPIIISESLREDLNAAGVHDGVTTDKATIALVNMKRFYIGMRRPLQSRVMMDLPNQDRWLLASYTRWDFKGHTQDANETSVVIGRNIQT